MTEIQWSALTLAKQVPWCIQNELQGRAFNGQEPRIAVNKQQDSRGFGEENRRRIRTECSTTVERNVFGQVGNDQVERHLACYRCEAIPNQSILGRTLVEAVDFEFEYLDVVKQNLTRLDVGISLRRELHRAVPRLLATGLRDAERDPGFDRFEFLPVLDLGCVNHRRSVFAFERAWIPGRVVGENRRYQHQ